MKTGDDLIPELTHYPICSRCHLPYVFRWGLSLSQGEGWFWQRDCKCKGAEPEVRDRTES